MEDPKKLSIKELLMCSKNYIIPIYQRNYSWKEIQIEQLLQDIWDKHKDSSFYYIGTLIVDERDNDFVIVDGQQRYTTIILINAILKGIERLNNAILKDLDKPNLKFDARAEVENYIKQVYLNGYNEFKSRQELECQNIHLALRIIKDFLNKKNKEHGLEQYVDYFYNKVQIIQVSVPEKTDINHYFEIMNTRGEQLEAHEILKAWLIKNCEEGYRGSFAKIWEACSQMEVRVQTCFNKEERDRFFGKDLCIPIDEIKLIHDNKQSEDSNNRLADILEDASIHEDSNKTKSDQTAEKYHSIIDFPNFLLIILRIFLNDESISLDDKSLLKETGYGDRIEHLKVKHPEEFILFLLKCRVLFDNHIIKQEERGGKTDWYILKPKYGRDNTIYWVNTFGKEDTDDDEELKDMIMLQTMLQVSYPGNSFKNWLYDLLSWLTEQQDVRYGDFMKKSRCIARNLYQKEVEKIPFTYFNTERFVFNLLDYLLWKEYREQRKSLAKSQPPLANLQDEYKTCFDNFRFRGGNSIEHLFPQSKKDKIEVPHDQKDNMEEEKGTILNSFGNLCLISNGNNSKYSDLNFEAKKHQFLEHIKNQKGVAESLKQAIMFSNDKWNTTEINKHGKQMMDLLDRFKNEPI
jgi:uncharacterized protein with ParB-like and HNH nuclease domain